VACGSPCGGGDKDTALVAGTVPLRDANRYKDGEDDRDSGRANPPPPIPLLELPLLLLLLLLLPPVPPTRAIMACRLDMASALRCS